jgi:hypothetical protein
LANEAVSPAKIEKDVFAANETSTHDDASPLVLLTAPTGVTLAFQCHVKCLEAPGGSTPATFSAGDGTTADAFATTADYVAKDSVGDEFTFSGELAPGESLTITNTDGVDGTPAGAYRHCVLAMPISDAA